MRYLREFDVRYCTTLVVCTVQLFARNSCEESDGHFGDELSDECGPDLCLGLVCVYGRQVDDRGCVDCDCNQPCEDVVCGDGESCQIIRVSDCDGVHCSAYAGVCKGISTTPVAVCASVRCDVTCTYGYETDDAGCTTCLCRDPCRTVTCDPGMICQMSASDCRPEMQCRDAPMPFCAVAMNDSSLTTAPPPLTLSSSTRGNHVHTHENTTVTSADGNVRLKTTLSAILGIILALMIVVFVLAICQTCRSKTPAKPLLTYDKHETTKNNNDESTILNNSKQSDKSSECCV